MKQKIKVAILDDHQGIIYGYLYRLDDAEDIEVVATMLFGDELRPALTENHIDVLLLDIQVPTNEDNPNPYPILYILPNIIQEFPDLSVLIITMHAQRTMIHTLMEAGASGYILKEDQRAINELPSLIRNIAEGGIYLSKLAYEEWMKSRHGDLNQPLSPRQVEALSLCASYPNASTAELAQKMNIAHSTMRNLLSKAYIKLNVNNRTAAIMEARRLGLVITDP